MITKFQGKYEFLSNFYPHYKHLTVEHEFQAAKTNDTAWQDHILKAESPGLAKYRGQRCALRADWEDIKLAVMHQALRNKFAITRLGELLRATGAEELVEGNTWHDNYWGVCSCDRCGYDGQNWLGRLLMIVRSELNWSAAP